MKNKQGKVLLIGLLLGGTIGALSGLLFAPKSGIKLRQNIKNKSEEYSDDAEKYISDARKKSEKLISDAKIKAGELLKDAEKIFKKAKTSNTVQKAKKTITTFKEPKPS